MPEGPHFQARASFGGLDLDLCCAGKSLATVQIPDADLNEVLKRGLERLAGQGKVDEELRQMCHCLGCITK